jgi:cell division protein FtsN
MAQARRTSKQSKQAGGTFMGVVLGLIVGLAIAVIVALYITRAPSPFVSKVPAPTELGASEAFDPNRALQGKSPGVPVQPQVASATPAASGPSLPPLLPQIVEVPGNGANAASAPVLSNPQASTNNGNTASVTPPAPSPATPPVRKPAPTTQADNANAAALMGAPLSSVRPASQPRAEQAQARPAAPAASGQGTPPNAETSSIYFLQVGAYTSQTDAEQQRAKLGFQGFESRVSTRPVNGATYYRVRVGPFSKFEDMNSARQRLSEAGIDSAVVRTIKQ